MMVVCTYHIRGSEVYILDISCTKRHPRRTRSTENTGKFSRTPLSKAGLSLHN